jgi:hypothetical protein
MYILIVCHRVLRLMAENVIDVYSLQAVPNRKTP